MKSALTAIALCTVLVTGATTANAACGVRNTCSTCAVQYAPVEYETVCTTCNPCGGRGFNLINPSTWF